MEPTGRTHAQNKAARRQHIIESAFRTFSGRTIDAVNLTEVARAAGVGVATVYRYFDSKTQLVLEASTWAWSRFIRENRAREDISGRSGAGQYAFFLDAFIELYRNHRDILRFNQFFNVYVQREDVTAEHLRPFNYLVDNVARRFHECYEKGMADHTLRADCPEREMFSRTLRLMLAAVTRYAVGLVYDTGADPEAELVFLKELLLREYTRLP